MTSAHIAAIDLNLAVSLLALLEERHVSRAARRSGVTQSAMSRSLGRLRAHLGDPLLVRAGRALVATRRAEALLPEVRALLAQAERLFLPPAGRAGAAFDLARFEGTLRIATSDHVAIALLPELERIAAREAPRLHLHVGHVERRFADQLAEGTLDLVIAPPAALAPGLCSEPLFEDPFVCLMRRRHPLSGKRLTLSRYLAASQVLVAPLGGALGRADEALSARGRRRRIGRTVEHFVTALWIVAGSDHLVTVPQSLAARFAPRLGLSMRPVPPELELTPVKLSSAWHPGREGQPGHAWLRGALARAAAAVPSAPGRLTVSRRRSPRRSR